MKNILKCQSLRCRIFLLITIFTLVIVSFGYLFLTAYYDKLRLQNSDFLKTYASEKVTRINNYITTRQNILEYFADNNQALGENFKQVLDIGKDSQTRLMKFQHKELDRKIKYIFEYFDLYDIFIISNEGDILYTYKKESDLGQNLNTSVLKTSHFAKLFNDNKILMQTLHSDFDYYEPSEAQALFFTSPLYYEKKYIGLLAIQVDMKTMMDYILKDISALQEQGEIHIARMMLKNEHEIIYSHSFHPFSKDYKEDLELFLQKSELMTHSYISPSDKLQGLIQLIPSLNLDLIIKADAEDIFSQFQFVKQLSVYLFIFILFSISALLYIFHNQILKPIKKLNNATNALAKGDYNTDLDLKQNDEISQLAENFNDMGRQIKQRSKQLETQAIHLNHLLQHFDKHIISSKTDTKGILIYVSEAFCKINGYLEEELIGKSQNIGRHPDMPASLFKELWNTISSGKEWRGEIKNISKDGHSYWVDVRISPEFDEEGMITGYSAIRHDITAQKELEELTVSLDNTIKERTKELNRAQEIAKLGHWIIDLKDNTLNWSDEVYRIMGLHPQSVPQNFKSFLGFVHPDDRRRVHDTYWKSVKENTPYYIKHRIYQEGDGIRYVEEMGEHKTDEEGKVITSFGTIHDITELTKVQVELEKMNNELEERIKEAVERQKSQQKYLMQQSKMAAMGEMISMIAHQWRQPLSAISATTVGLQVDMALDNFNEETFDKKFNDINKYIQHMSHTIDDFRNFFKPDKKAEEIKVNEVLDATLDIIRLGFERHHIRIIKNYHTNTLVSTYKNELIQVLLNLFKNAQDNFIEHKIIEPIIEVSTSEENETQVIKIIDNGGGIPEEYLEKIFEPYFSTKDEKNGTGLGLYMSKIIIDDHCKGSLEVINKNGGAEFTIKFKDINIEYDL